MPLMKKGIITPFKRKKKKKKDVRKPNPSSKVFKRLKKLTRRKG